MSAREKSDLPEVAEKRANKVASAAAELVERRGGAKENAELQSTVRTQSRAAVSQAQSRAVRKAIAEAAQNKPKRARSTKNIAVAVEKAIDLIADYMQSLQDADLRSVLAERLLSIANWKPEPEPPAPAGPEPTPVQKGKKKTAKPLAIDYEDIAMRYLPHGYRVEYRKNLSGMHYGHQS
jgi:hypothetical protein